MINISDIQLKLLLTWKRDTDFYSKLDTLAKYNIEYTIRYKMYDSSIREILMGIRELWITEFRFKINEQK